MVPKPELWAPQPVVAFMLDKEEVKKTFVIHKSLAISSSSFFKTAFERNSIESETQTMRLEDVESHIFGLLVHWLYTRNIEDHFKTGGCSGTEVQLLEYAKLWTLAGRCLIPALQNDIVRTLIILLHCSTICTHEAFIHYAYKSDKENTALKRLAVDTMAFLVDAAELKSCMKDLPRDFVDDLVITLKDQACSGRKRLWAAEYYEAKVQEEKPEVPELIKPTPKAKPKSTRPRAIAGPQDK